MLPGNVHAKNTFPENIFPGKIFSQTFFPGNQESSAAEPCKGEDVGTNALFSSSTIPKERKKRDRVFDPQSEFGGGAQMSKKIMCFARENAHFRGDFR